MDDTEARPAENAEENVENNDLGGKLVSLSDHVSSVFSEIEQIHALVQQQYQTLEDREAQLVKLQEELEVERSKGEQQKETLETRAEEIEKAEEELKQRREQVESQFSEIETHETVVQEKEAELEGRMQELAEREKHYEELNQNLDTRLAEIETRLAAVQEQEQSLAQREAAAAQLQRAVADIAAVFDDGDENESPPIVEPPTPHKIEIVDTSKLSDEEKQQLSPETDTVFDPEIQASPETQTPAEQPIDEVETEAEEDVASSTESVEAPTSEFIPDEVDIEELEAADVPPPSGSVDEEGLSEDELNRLRVLRRLTGGNTPDSELLIRIRSELGRVGVESTTKKKRGWFR